MSYKLDTYINKILSYFIIIILVSEFITKGLITYRFDFYQVSSTTKIIIEILLLVYFFKNRLWTNKYSKFTLYIILFFIIGQLFTTINSEFTYENILNNIFTLNTYLYLPLLAICVLHRDVKEIIINNIKIIKKIALINSFAIVTGLISGIELFRSYPNSQRFGYNGLIGFSSSASFFYIAVIAILYVEFIKKKTLPNILFLISQLLFSIIVGTKTIWFFIILLSIIHFCIIIKKPYRHIFQSLGLIALTLFLIFRKKVELFIVSLFNFGEYYYNKHGFITVITSTRDLYLKKVWYHYLDSGTIYNALFGGMNVFKIRVEFEFINMFIFFGFVGMFTYLLLLKQLFVVSKQQKIKTLIFIAVILTCAMSGGLFYSVFSSIIIYMVFKYIDILTDK